MGMLTSGRVEIAAPAMDVFDWLVDPVKLTAWLGGSGAGSAKVEITAFEPPTHLVYRSTYTGGDSISTYTLTEVDGHTTLVLEGDTDWGRPTGGLEAAADQAMAGQPESVLAAAEAQMVALEQQLGDGAFDATAQPQLQLQQAVDAQLAKLKVLVEGSQTAKK
ncbi:hypothetical protein BH11ACT3_BH11ACT3_15400 [soil metagenome]